MKNRLTRRKRGMGVSEDRGKPGAWNMELERSEHLRFEI